MNRIRSLLQLFIAAVVTAGAVASELPDVFGDHAVKIQITVAPDELRSLRSNSRKDVSAEVLISGKKWSRVAMHLKGNGTFQTIDEKPSLTLKFADSKIHLNNSADDSSALNEFVGAHIFKAAGIETPKVGHGVVMLNGKDLGLYVIKDGFKTESIELPSAGVSNWEELKRVVDVNSFCAFMALEVMTCHWDGYSLRENNFHLSRQPATGLFVFQPAGMDQLFGKPDFNWKPDMTGRLARIFMAAPEGRELYAKQFRRLFGAVLDPEALRRLIEKRVQEISPVLAKTESARVRSEGADLCDRIAKRHIYLENELKKADNEEVAAARGRKNAGL